MKKKNMLIVIIIIVVLLIIALIFGLRNHIRGPYEGSISTFHYSYGSYNGGYYNYDIMIDEKHYILTATGYNGVQLNVNKKITKNDVKKLQNLINQQKIYEWNGFDQADDGVLDGYSFTLEITYIDGETFTASGYMKYPKDYEKRIKPVREYLEKLCK